MKDTKLTKKDPGALVTNNIRPRGFEEPTDKTDLIIPRAMLMQSTSEPFKMKPKEYDLGEVYNSLTLERLPEEFIPVFKFTNWIRFNPRSEDKPGFDPDYEPGAIIWRSSDPLDPKVKAESSFGENGEAPLATKFLNFFAYFPGASMPVIISFSKTSFKAGKQLLSLAQFAGCDMFQRKYRLGSKLINDPKGSYYAFTIAPAGMPKEDELKMAEKYWTEFAAKADKLTVHEEGAAEEKEDAPF